MVDFKPTNKNLQLTADAMESTASECLPVWTILGQTEKYGEAMECARRLRHAMTITGLRARAEYLRVAR